MIWNAHYPRYGCAQLCACCDIMHVSVYRALLNTPGLHIVRHRLDKSTLAALVHIASWTALRTVNSPFSPPRCTMCS